MFDLVVYVLVRIRNWLLAAMLLLACVAAFYASQLRFDFSPEALFGGGGSEQILLSHELIDLEKNIVVIALESSGNQDVFAPEALNWQYQVARSLAKHDRIREVHGLPTIRLPNKFAAIGQRKYVWLFETKEHSAETASKFKTKVLEIDQIGELLLSDDLRCTGIFVPLSADNLKIDQIAEIVSAIEEVLVQHPCPAGFQAHMSGLPYLRVKIIELLKSDQKILVPIAAGFIAIIMLFLFRSIGSIVLTAIALGTSLLWTFAVLVIYNQPINIITNVLPVILLVVGASNCIHILNRYSEESHSGKTNVRALRSTMSQMVPACLLTTLTTAIGFLSLVFASSDLLQKFGWQSAMGLGLVLISILITFLSAAAWVDAPKASKNLRFWLTVAVGKLSKAAIRFPIAVVVLSILPVVFSIFASQGLLGFKGVKVNSFLAESIEEDNEYLKSMQVVEKQLGGFLPLEIILTAESSQQLESIDFLNRLRRIKQQVMEIEDVTLVRSLFDLVAIGDSQSLGIQAISEEQDIVVEDYSIDRIAKIIANLKKKRKRSGLQLFLSQDGQDSRIAVNTRDIGTRRGREIVKRIEDIVANEFPVGGNVRTQMSGEMYIGIYSLDKFVVELLTSLFTATLLIFIALAIFFRSFKLGLVSIPPNLIPLVITLGYMGVHGYDLNVGNVTVFAIGLGIAVDDTIHFLARYREEIIVDGNPALAIQRTTEGTGKAIVLTTILIIGGMVILSTSSFIPTQRFAELTIVVLASALVGDLLLLPAIIRLVYGAEKRKQN